MIQEWSACCVITISPCHKGYKDLACIHGCGHGSPGTVLLCTNLGRGTSVEKEGVGHRGGYLGDSGWPTGAWGTLGTWLREWQSQGS